MQRMQLWPMKADRHSGFMRAHLLHHDVNKGCHRSGTAPDAGMRWRYRR